MGYHHARVYSELEREGEVTLVGVADIDKKRAEQVAKKFNTKPYTDYRQLLKEDIEAVSIAVPTTLHKEVATYFAKNKVHILVEKPIADTPQNAAEIIRTAKDNNVILMVGHIERFNPAVQKLKEVIERRELGDIVTISAKRVGPLPPRIKDVGVIIDLAVHDIDIIRYITNKEIVEVYAKARNSIHPAGVEDAAIILLTLEDNIHAIIETNWLTPYKIRKLTVVGTEAVAELDYIQQTLTIHKQDKTREVPVTKEEPLKRELKHFIECIKTNKNPLVTGEDGLKALIIATKALESTKWPAM